MTIRLAYQLQISASTCGTDRAHCLSSLLHDRVEHTSVLSHLSVASMSAFNALLQLYDSGQYFIETALSALSPLDLVLVYHEVLDDWT